MQKALINYRYILILLSKILILILFIDPSNKITGLKNVIFISICSIWFLWILSTKRYIIHFPRKFSFLPIFIFFILVYSITILIFKGEYLNLNESLNYLKSFIFLFYLIILIDSNIQIEYIFMKYSIIIVIITILFFLFYLFIPEYFTICYDYFVQQKGVAKFATRLLFNKNIVMLFYHTSPILVFPLSYYLFQYKKSRFLLFTRKKIIYGFISLIIFSSLILSGTRANILSAILLVLFYLLIEPILRIKIDTRYKYVLFSYFILIIILLLSIFVLPEYFNPEETSNKIKINHFYSYIKLFIDNPNILFFGQGLGAVFYTQGTNAYTFNTEFSYFDLVRFFGLPIALLFMIVLIIPFLFYIYKYNFFKNKSYIYVSYLFYLFIAGTNPLLLSSTGMIVIIMVYSSVIFSII